MFINIANVKIFNSKHILNKKIFQLVNYPSQIEVFTYTI